MDDNADIPDARDGMAPPVRRRAFTSGWDTAVVKEPSSDFSGGCASENRSHEWAVDPSVDQQRKRAGLLICGGCDDNGNVDDSADIPARCASTTLAGGLRASKSDLDPEMATGPSCDFGGIALQAVVTGISCQVL